MPNPEKGFLETKYPDLPRSEEVESAVRRKQTRTGERVKGDPSSRTEAYLTRLEEIFLEPEEGEEATLKGEPIREQRVDILKGKLHDLFVVERENVPESYFDLQKRIAHERGHGDIEIPEQVREQMIDTVIIDQEKSLDSWVNYLSSKDAPYPSWFKYYVFRNITKLSSYDKEKKQFGQRSRGTTALFPDIDHEAISYVYDNLRKAHIDKEKLDDSDIQKLFEEANFAKLYAYAIEEATPETEVERESVAGEWIKFDQGDDPAPLHESLQGHGTGWCTAGQGAAATQLEGGDFYVYYSKDKDGQSTIPRAAIRMEGSSIAEVRGVNSDQNLEPQMTDIANDKMQTLPGHESYEKKTADMKWLTEIESMSNAGQELDKDDLRFLYEIEGSVQGFGYREDPRIEALKSNRDPRQDYATLFDCRREQVARYPGELSDSVLVFEGDLNFRFYHLPKQLKHIVGSADLRHSKVESLGSLQTIGGGANFRHSKVESLGSLQTIGGGANFRQSKVESHGSLQSIGGNADFRYSEVESLGSLQTIGGHADFKDSKVESLGSLQTIGGGADFRYSKVESLGSLQTIGGNVHVDMDSTLDFSAIKIEGQILRK